MRWWLAGLLAFLLAACDGNDPSAPPPPEEVVDAPQVIPADPRADRLRAEWMRIEHAGWGAEFPVEMPEPAADPRPQIAIIIDDVGHNYAYGRRLIDLPQPVALAILPYTHSGNRLAAEANAAGRTVMLHLPMENSVGLSIGQGGLYAGMSRLEFDAVLQASLDNVGPIQGVNNHMGSLLTEQREQMDWVMQALKSRGLFFVDSRTSARTAAAAAAEAAGLRYLSRHVFLDNQRTQEAIDQAFSRGLAQARKQGMAVMIGHPYPETLAYLERRLPDLERQDGVQVVDVTRLLRGPSLP